MGRFGCLENWNREEDSPPPPWKNKLSEFLKVPGASSVERIRTDLAHTWAIGVGKEFCGSALLTLCDLGLVRGKLGHKLNNLYADFREWCHTNHECCKINEFSKKVLKIQSCLYLACT